MNAGRPETITLPLVRGTYFIELAGRNNVSGEPAEQGSFGLRLRHTSAQDRGS